MNLPAASARNVPIDAARALSILVVVAFHLMLFGVDPASVGSGGMIRTFVGSPGPLGWVLSWFVMVMPLFFVAGGFANTHVLDRQRSEGGSYGTWLVTRARRLLGPLAFYIAVWTVAGTVVAWLGRLDTALLGTRKLTEVLWFLLVYLVIVVLAPVMCLAHDRWGVGVLVVLGAAAVGLDAVRFVLHVGLAGDANLVVVWLFVHQLGIAYHRGWWRTGPETWVWVTILGAVLLLLALLFGLPYYPRSAVGLGDQFVANLVPPTAPMAVLALAQTGVLALVERHFGVALGRSRVLQNVLGRLNALAVTIYLWHGPVIGLAIGLLYPFALRFRAATAVLMWRPVILLVAVPLMFVLFPLISQVEQLLVPKLGDEPRTGLAIASIALLLFGFGLIYHGGTVLHPGAPRATAGVLCFVAGALIFRDASRPARQHVRGVPDRPRRDRPGHDGPNGESAVHRGRA